MGGGALWDVGCYPLSYANYLAGTAPVEVFAWERQSDRGVDMECFATLRYADGSIAQFDCGFSRPFRTDMEVAGATGVLRIHRPFKTDDRSRLELTIGETVEDLPFAPDTAYQARSPTSSRPRSTAPRRR